MHNHYLDRKLSIQVFLSTPTPCSKSCVVLYTNMQNTHGRFCCSLSLSLSRSLSLSLSRSPGLITVLGSSQRGNTTLIFIINVFYRYSYD